MSSIDPERLNRKETLKALSRAVRVYWEHETALPLPEHLVQLAAKADEVLGQCLATPGIVPSDPDESGEMSGQVTQVKDID